jgi:hypothetical protein
MKVELYQSGDHLEELITDAEYLMHNHVRRDVRLKTTLFDFEAEHDFASKLLVREATPEGIDLVLNGIEVGSYGVRTVGNRTWTYGTGLALPRFTVAIDNFSP